ncbi:aromatic amino acid lyase, partial [Burkholderia sp. E168m30]
QEDHLCHATPAALKALDIIENTTRVLAIELLAAAQAYDLQPGETGRAASTDALWRHVRERAPAYHDDRPLADDIAIAAGIVAGVPPSLR